MLRGQEGSGGAKGVGHALGLKRMLNYSFEGAEGSDGSGGARVWHLLGLGLGMLWLDKA